ncbi:MAG: hypothetical protein ABFS14_11445 [Gemmatimonadota bacterium]
MAAALLASLPTPAAAQSLPGPAYHDLSSNGYEKLASRLSKRLELRSNPDSSDVANLLDQWSRETGGPETGYDWLAVTRLWLRAEQATPAGEALARAEGSIPKSQYLLDRARIAFLAGAASEGDEHYWRGCSAAEDDASIEYWLDVQSLATPDEFAAWEAFLTLPPNQRDLCRLLSRMWNRRAAAAGLSVEDRIALHYQRLRFAQNHYLRRGKKEPTFTTRLGRPRNAVFDDRGLVFLRMGDPDDTSMFLGDECFEPNITWSYEYPGGNRLYHFSPGGGTDDWWLIPNLGLVFRCGAGGRNPFSTAPTALGLIPAGRLTELYRSRSGLDIKYQQIAYRGGGVVVLQEMAREREWTRADGAFAVSDVPDRPPVDRDSRLVQEMLQFRAPAGDRTRVWLNAVIEADDLTPVSEGGELPQYRLSAVWSVLTETGEYDRKTYDFDLSTDRVLGKGDGIPVRIRADLPPGTHTSTLVVSERGDPAAGPVKGGYLTDSLTVRRLTGTVPILSDIVVAPDSGGLWTPGGGVYLKPDPAHTTGPDGVAYVYFEAYNLSQGTAYTTRVRLEPIDDDGEPFELSYPGESSGRGRVVTRSSLRVDLSQTEPGIYRMSISVLDHDSGLTTLPSRTEIVVDSDRSVRRREP